MKKLLFINSSLTGGGSERVMTLLANYFSDEYDVSMILVREKSEENYKTKNKVNLIKFKYNSHNKILIFLKRFIMLRKTIKNLNPDCVISFMTDINFTTLLACMGLKVKIIVSERADPKYRSKKILKGLLEKMLYPISDKIVFQTELVKSYYNEKIQKKSVVIPNPVNPELITCEKTKKSKKIIAVGRLTEQKNFALLIESFSQFHNKFPDYKLEICGDGPLKQELIDFSKNLKILDFVEFSGFISNVNEHMAKAEIYVSTSNYEGISNSMIEALAMGIPTICTDCPVGGASLMIKNRENGILIPVGDGEALTQALIELASNIEFCQKIGKSAQKVKDDFSIDKIGKMWKKIIES